MDAEGWILAGGRSLRMGRDKAGVALGERTLLEHMLDKLRALRRVWTHVHQHFSVVTGATNEKGLFQKWSG